VSWLERMRSRPAADPESPKPDASGSAPVERASPGLSALFDRLKDDGRHSMLDLGVASNRHLKLFGRYARQIRFAGLVPWPPRGEALTKALETLPPNTEQPYDVVLAWDIFDRLEPDERSALVGRLAELTAPGARMYAVVDSSGAATTRPLELIAADVDRISQRAIGPSEPARPQLLPAHVERLLAPFEVVHAYSLRIGLREYVAQKEAPRGR